MKTEVYSWWVSSDQKGELEREARRRKISFAAILDEAARQLIEHGRDGDSDQEEQAGLQEAAAKCFGAIDGRDVHRSEKAREGVRDRLRRRYGR